MSSLITTLRQRARSVLSRAIEDGRLDDVLEKTDAFSEIPEAKAPDSLERKPSTKKRDRGRGIEAALNAGKARASVVIAEEAIKPEPEKEASKRKGSKEVDVEISAKPKKSASRKSVVVQVLPESNSPKDNSPKAQYLSPKDGDLSPSEEDMSPQERKLFHKFDEGDRQAEKEKRRLQLHRQRMAFVDNGIFRPLLDDLVTRVSREDERPDNPVPLMISLLAEHLQKPVSAFKSIGPETRYKREIRELQKHIAELEEILAQEGSDYTDASDAEEEEGEGESP